MALDQCLEALAIYENTNAHAIHPNTTRANATALLPSRINETITTTTTTTTTTATATTTTGRSGASAGFSGSGLYMGERRSSSSSTFAEEKTEIVVETEVDKALLSSSSSSSHGSRVSEGQDQSRGKLSGSAMDMQQQQQQQQRCAYREAICALRVAEMLEDVGCGGLTTTPTTTTKNNNDNNTQSSLLSDHHQEISEYVMRAISVPYLTPHQRVEVTAQGALVFQRAGLKRKYALLLYLAALMSTESGLTRTAHILLQKCSKQYGESIVSMAVATDPPHAISTAPSNRKSSAVGSVKYWPSMRVQLLTQIARVGREAGDVHMAAEALSTMLRVTSDLADRQQQQLLVWTAAESQSTQQPQQQQKPEQQQKQQQQRLGDKPEKKSVTSAVSSGGKASEHQPLPHRSIPSSSSSTTSSSSSSSSRTGLPSDLNYFSSKDRQRVRDALAAIPPTDLPLVASNLKINAKLTTKTTIIPPSSSPSPSVPSDHDVDISRGVRARTTSSGIHNDEIHPFPRQDVDKGHHLYPKSPLLVPFHRVSEPCDSETSRGIASVSTPLTTRLSTPLSESLSAPSSTPSSIPLSTSLSAPLTSITTPMMMMMRRSSPSQSAPGGDSDCGDGDSSGGGDYSDYGDTNSDTNTLPMVNPLSTSSSSAATVTARSTSLSAPLATISATATSAFFAAPSLLTGMTSKHPPTPPDHHQQDHHQDVRKKPSGSDQHSSNGHHRTNLFQVLSLLTSSSRTKVILFTSYLPNEEILSSYSHQPTYKTNNNIHLIPIISTNVVTNFPRRRCIITSP